MEFIEGWKPLGSVRQNEIIQVHAIGKTTQTERAVCVEKGIQTEYGNKHFERCETCHQDILECPCMTETLNMPR